MRIVLALGLLAVIGCSRTFSDPQGSGGPQQPLGTVCDDGSQCATGFCVDGVCCNVACPASQRCDLPGGALGRCTDRPLGEPCADGSTCPSGNCVEGVCCNEPCQELCHTCAGSKPGTCQLANDDTDPHRDCAANGCSACFAGACAPALPGSDPDQSCTPDKTCGVDQQCGGFDGGECSSSAQCAVGTCLAGACLRLDDEVIQTNTMNTFADARDVAGVALNSDGDRAVLFTESQNVFSLDESGGLVVSPVENEAYLALQPAGGAWSAVPLFQASDLSLEDLYSVIGRVVLLGRQPLAIAEREPDDGVACSDEAVCGMVAVAAAPTGEVGHFEQIDRSAVEVGYVDAVVDAQGRVAVAYSDDRGTHVKLRTGANTWVALSDFDHLPGGDPSIVPAIQAVGDDLYMVYVTSSPGVGVSFVDGGNPQSILVGSGLDCGSFSPSADFFNDESAKGPALADHLAITAMCNDDPTGSGDDPGRVLNVTFTPNVSPSFTSEPIADGLGFALASSDGKWVAYEHPTQTAHGGSDYTDVGLGWRKDDGTWVTKLLRTAPPGGPRPSLAMSGDGAFPFAAYGIDAYDTSSTSDLTASPTVTGSELHAIVVRR